MFNEANPNLSTDFYGPLPPLYPELGVYLGEPQIGEEPRRRTLDERIENVYEEAKRQKGPESTLPSIMDEKLMEELLDENLLQKLLLSSASAPTGILGANIASPLKTKATEATEFRALSPNDKESERAESSQGTAPLSSAFSDPGPAPFSPASTNLTEEDQSEPLTTNKYQQDIFFGPEKNKQLMEQRFKVYKRIDQCPYKTIDFLEYLALTHYPYTQTGKNYKNGSLIEKAAQVVSTHLNNQEIAVEVKLALAYKLNHLWSIKEGEPFEVERQIFPRNKYLQDSLVKNLERVGLAMPERDPLETGFLPAEYDSNFLIKRFSLSEQLFRKAN